MIRSVAVTAALMIVCAPAWSADAAAPAQYVLTAPVIEQVSPTEVLASGGVTITSDDWTITADRVRGDIRSQTWTAEGNVHFVRPGSELAAASATYDALAKTGELSGAGGKYGAFQFHGGLVALNPDGTVSLQDALATTCTLPHPHWSITARSLRLYGSTSVTQDSHGIRMGTVTIASKYAVARGLRIRLGSTTLFALPRYRFELQRSATSLLPTPGYDRRDGMYLRYRYPLLLPWASASSAAGRLTQKNGILWSFDAQRSLPWEPPAGSPSEPVPEVATDLTAVSLLANRADRRSLLPGRDTSLPSVAPLGRSIPSANVFLRLAHKERVWDPDTQYLHVDRLPELGLRVTGIPIGRTVARGNRFTVDSQIGFGRFRERPSDSWHSRIDARAVARLNANIGRRWLLEPALFARVSTYSSGQNQRILASSLAVGRELSQNYFAALTYVRHLTSGASPFEFDDLDVKEKLATRLEADMGSTRGSLTFDFDLQRGGLYDWGLNIAHIFHCIEPRIQYQHRYRDLNVGVAFVVPR